MAVTVRLGITELVVGQSGGEILFNEAMNKLDVAVFPTIKDKDLTAPPGSPAEGDAYIPAATATGDWAGKENNIAFFDNGWKFIAPDEGMVLYIDDEKLYYRNDGTVWLKQSQGLFPVEAKTGDYTIVTPDDVGKLFTNTGAGGTITFTLPAATVGQHYWFAIGAVQEMRIDPDGSENISLPTSGVLQGNGKYIQSAIIGETLHIISAVAGTWNVWGNTGAWEVQP